MSQHPAHAMHENSLQGYAEERSAGRLGKRCAAIVSVLERDTMQHLGRSDRMLMSALGFTDPNSVRPRINELLKAKVLEECGTVTDRETGKRVRLVRIKKKPELQENLKLF